MELHSELVTRRTPTEVFPWVDDLDRYPEWMRLTHSVQRLADAGCTDETPAWSVELRAKVGPLARSKRLRMVRTVRRHDERVVFERRELDGRQHSPWVLTVELEDLAPGTRLGVHLHYGGRLWTGGVLERVLADEVDRGRARLSELLDGPGR